MLACSAPAQNSRFGPMMPARYGTEIPCIRRIGARLSIALPAVGSWKLGRRTVFLCIAAPGMNVLYCRESRVLLCRVAGLDWRLGRVYFLAFFNPLRGRPDP